MLSHGSAIESAAQQSRQLQLPEATPLRSAAFGGRLCEALGLVSILVHIRHREGEEPALFEIYYSAIHLVACQHYTPEQVQAWAPRELDPELWRGKIRGISPFVADSDGQIVGYADLQPNGYIDHFFVSGTRPRQGIGSQLMRYLLDQAQALGIPELTSDVSRTAQPFYEKFGFSVVERRYPEVRGVVIQNALMRRTRNEQSKR